MSTPVHFDHVLIQLSTPDFHAPPPWLTENFTILEGGTHAGGVTRNNLIPLPDGTYIELLNFVTPPASRADWASKYPGDFALTTLPPVTATENYNRLVSALEPSPNEPGPEPGPRAGDGGLGVTYKKPIPGGRQLSTGEDVKWEIVGPEYKSEDGGARGPTDVPFFCHDVTERRVRVPRVPETGHPSGAVGVKAIEVLVGRERVGDYVQLYTSVLGVEGEARKDGDGEWEFPLRAPGAEDVTGVVRLRGSRTEEDERL
ncbi:hypothetical protein P170DRAFT_466846 [Aspergillus steynii IBT 23096]|uniref:Glyoxalase-like domain-containing protein n=1 Tax=Aspergillus steynii IBT 23096 TaxID=1392250 RepID=A0A2I2FY52_9EURO|nr:uncharacterized protein P170DRAFT_466846 [Aspergillus steynii IBT 23096]PLB45565.1 hypothetical protein P170DRAFT_466846 [Aspergillus steynii IBT 23096]